MTSPNQRSDRETRRVPTDQLEQYFTRFTRNFLIRESTNSVDVEVLGADSGDQFEAEGAKIFGITFDPRENSVEFELEGGDHRIINPKEVWVAEEPDGFVTAIEVVRDDGTREIARVKRGALASPPSSGASSADAMGEQRSQ
jgi:hypothetical protein